MHIILSKAGTVKAITYNKAVKTANWQATDDDDDDEFEDDASDEEGESPEENVQDNTEPSPY